MGASSRLWVSELGLLCEGVAFVEVGVARLLEDTDPLHLGLPRWRCQGKRLPPTIRWHDDDLEGVFQVFG